jgi:uncharacterized Zn-finger protein
MKKINLSNLFLFTLICIVNIVNGMDIIPFREKKLYTCDTCPKQFTQERSLLEHIERHTGEKSFTCNRCPKKFYTERHLNRHTKLHAKTKSYPCTRCPKQFTQKHFLVVHTKRHNGERTFECNVCNVKFFTNGNLTTHKKSKRHIKNLSYLNIINSSKPHINIEDCYQPLISFMNTAESDMDIENNPSFELLFNTENINNNLLLNLIDNL